MSEGKKEELMWSNAGFYEIDDSVKFFFPRVSYFNTSAIFIF